MNIKNEYPPNIEEIKKTFTLTKGIIFTYGDTIFNPDDMAIDIHLLTHERRHSVQQGDNPKDWWERYLVDEPFRFYQELQAYQDQYQSAKRSSNNRELVNAYAVRCAQDLGSGIYGNMITPMEALKAIKQNKLYQFDL
jgi:hypothetical protein